MSETDNDRINAEHIKKWQRLDELDSSAISGQLITGQQFQAYCASIKNGAYLQEDLQAVQKQKQKLLQTLNLLEEIENTLKAEIAQSNRQLGELAACLARIKAWCLIEDSFREVVPVILDESLLYVSLLQQENDMAELTQLKQLLEDWRERWVIIASSPSEVTVVVTTATTWSERLLDMSGLLVAESKSA